MSLPAALTITVILAILSTPISFPALRSLGAPEVNASIRRQQLANHD